MLLPRKSKYRKQFRGRRRGTAKGQTTVQFGDGRTDALSTPGHDRDRPIPTLPHGHTPFPTPPRGDTVPAASTSRKAAVRAHGQLPIQQRQLLTTVTAAD